LINDVLESVGHGVLGMTQDTMNCDDDDVSGCSNFDSGTGFDTSQIDAVEEDLTLAKVSRYDLVKAVDELDQIAYSKSDAQSLHKEALKLITDFVAKRKKERSAIPAPSAVYVSGNLPSKKYKVTHGTAYHPTAGKKR